ncbi:hypothetical protein EVAR_12296_1 [Eumeta japonica]|uniref:Uncharacterized protein n=1 Tax=Eumeta variegata TaxID=151549 RepID=A0A4C1TUL5_EUMVA|nr:hypothetical protein EVAR_12296_1 [Eumeta japonica]
MPYTLSEKRKRKALPSVTSLEEGFLALSSMCDRVLLRGGRRRSLRPQHLKPSAAYVVIASVTTAAKRLDQE